MTRRTYTPEYKAKLVIEVLQGEKELNTIAAENSISPNMLRNWKVEFLENAGRAFDGSRQAKEARRKEVDLKKTQAQMLKTIFSPIVIPFLAADTALITLAADEAIAPSPPHIKPLAAPLIAPSLPPVA